MAGGRDRDLDRCDDLALLQRREISALIEVARLDGAVARRAGNVIRGIEAHHQRRHVVAGIAVGDVATERAHISDLRIGDKE